MAKATKPTATRLKTAVARVLIPTTKVRTAIAILIAVTFPEGRGLFAKDWAIAVVSQYPAIAREPDIKAEIKQRKGVGGVCSVVVGWLSGLVVMNLISRVSSFIYYE
jgi:hypothetical protein